MHCQSMFMNTCVIVLNFLRHFYLQDNLASNRDSISGIQSTVQTFKVSWSDMTQCVTFSYVCPLMHTG